MSVLQAARGQGQRFLEDLLRAREFCVQSNTSQVHDACYILPLHNYDVKFNLLMQQFMEEENT